MFNEYLIILLVALQSHAQSGMASSLRKTNSTTEEESHSFTCNGGIHRGSHTPGTSPTIQINSYDLTKFVDSHVVITCTVSANPAANITWYFEKKKLRTQDRHKIDRESCGQTLRIPIARVGDSGTYTCEADNGYGTPTRKSCYLHVMEKDRACSVVNKGITLTGASNGKAIVGLPLNMTCEVYYAKQLRWEKNGRDFSPASDGNGLSSDSVFIKREMRGSRRSRVHIQHLIFSSIKPNDSGNYSCIGKYSGYDMVRKDIHLETVVQPVALRRSTSASQKPNIAAVTVWILFYLSLCC